MDSAFGFRELSVETVAHLRDADANTGIDRHEGCSATIESVHPRERCCV